MDKLKLNLGCGKWPMEGWVNIDITPLPGVDLVMDLGSGRLPFDDGSVSEFLAVHMLEHLEDPLPFMEELYRVAEPGATAKFKVPYGSSDEAWEDPTHVRPYFLKSWGYFSQPFYWRADYGYRGDWDTEEIELIINPDFAGVYSGDIMEAVMRQRNVVAEMIATLRAIKPPREPQRALQTRPKVRLSFGMKI